MNLNSLLICLILVVVRQTTALKIKLFGDSLTEEEYRDREFCSTKVCILDSDRLISSVTRNESAQPCDDFKVYAMGEFLKHRVVNERYPVLGFEIEVVQRFNARNRKILSEPIDQTDQRIFKVIKSFYKKCVDSNLVTSKGPEDFISHLKDIGNFPLTSNGTWNDDSFDIETIIYNPTLRFTTVFLDHEFSRCINPNNRSNEVFCLRFQKNIEFYDSVEEDYIDMLKPLPIGDSVVKKSLLDFVDFLKLKKVAFDEHQHDDEKQVMTIKEMTQLYPASGIDWLKLINLNMFEDSQVTEDYKVGIQNPKLMQKLLDIFKKLDKRAVANVVALTFAEDNKQTFDVYAFSARHASQLFSKKSVNRYERCLLHVSLLFPQAFLSFTATKYFDETIQTSAHNLASEAMNDLIENIESKIIFDDSNFKETILKKLKSTKLSIMYPSEAMNQTSMAEFHNELSIDGSESLLSMLLTAKFHQFKLSLAEKTNWKRKMFTLFSNHRKYLIDENILIVPIQHTLFPSFHPHRPKFLNMATFYMPIADVVFSEINNYLNLHSQKANTIDPSSGINLADENYVRWEANGGKELELSAFRLTNRQMMWLSMANRLTNKFHRDPVKHNSVIALTIQLSDFFKTMPGFLEAFSCEKPVVSF